MQDGDAVSENEALDHVEHCDVLITGCMHTVADGRVLGCHVAIDEDLSALDLTAVAETLGMLAGRICELARAKAGAN
jgi:hypothetical protein